MELYLCSCWAFFGMEKAGLSGPQSRCMKASGFFVAVNAVCRVCKLLYCVIKFVDYAVFLFVPTERSVVGKICFYDI